MSVSGEDSTVTTVTVVELAGGGARLCEGPRRKELNTGEVAPGHSLGEGDRAPPGPPGCVRVSFLNRKSNGQLVVRLEVGGPHETTPPGSHGDGGTCGAGRTRLRVVGMGDTGGLDSVFRMEVEDAGEIVQARVCRVHLSLRWPGERRGKARRAGLPASAWTAWWTEEPHRLR